MHIWAPRYHKYFAADMLRYPGEVWIDIFLSNNCQLTTQLKFNIVVNYCFHKQKTACLDFSYEKNTILPLDRGPKFRRVALGTSGLDRGGA